MAPVDLSTVDLAVLTTMRRHDMTTAAPRVNSEKICRQIVIDTGIAEVHGWEALLTLSRPWEVQNPLVDFRGDNGSPSDPPSDARYTEARLSRLGAFVADATARGEVTPVALMIGDVCRGGRRPPLRSARLVAALDAVIAGRVDADTIPAMCRDLEFATGAEIVTDCSLLLAGDAVTADVCARLDLVGDGEIQITGFPPGVGAQMALEMIRRVAGSRGGEAIRDVDDMSDVAGERLLVRLEASAAANEVVDRLARQWPLRIREELDFSSSLEDLLSEWAGQFATAANARTHLDAFVAAM